MFYLIDKPKGITSFFALKKLRSRLGIKKIGHTGTLDPLATGLLLVATEGSTKLIPYIEKAQKTYLFTMRMDGWTESGDLEKEVQSLDAEFVSQIGKELSTDVFEKNLHEKFLGKISQVPSKFSAIKVDGKAAYHAARKGKEVEIPSREIEVFDIKLLDFSFPEVTMEVTVSAGTYIRTLASDIAKSFGLDAYLTMLRRTRINHLDESLARELEPILKEQICPIPTIFPEYKILEVGMEVSELQAKRLTDGLTQNIQIPNGDYFLKSQKKLEAIIRLQDGIAKTVCANIE